MTEDCAARDYDALLVVSFGGPEGPEDVSPFLDKVFRGLSVTLETKTRVAKRYDTFGGVSPINAQTRAFIKALQRELDAHGPALPIYWGNRNWHPLLTDTLSQMAHAGVRRALAYVTSAFSSYSGCRKYREDLYEAAVRLPGAPRIDKLRVAYNHPGFIEAMADRVAAAFDALPENERSGALLLFTAHSLPESMARHCRYEAQLNASCRLVGDALERQRWRLVYQSNNASYGREPWLGPDVITALRDAKAEGATSVVIAPIGFVCDHIEVVLDLDIEAAAIARDLRPEDGARRDGRHASGLRRDGARADRRAALAGRAAPGARLARSEPRPLRRRLLLARPARPPKPALGGVDDPFSANA